MEGAPKENINRMRKILNGEDTSYRDLDEQGRANLLAALRSVAPDRVAHRKEEVSETTENLAERREQLLLNRASQTDRESIRDIDEEIARIDALLKDRREN